MEYFVYKNKLGNKKVNDHERGAVSYRTAKARDIGAINALYHQEYGREYPSFVTVKSFNSPEISVIVVVDAADSVVGVGQITRLKHTHGSYELNGLVVSPAYRGYKIGKLLLEKRIRMLQNKRARIAYSEPVCREKECRSQHNLTRAGFALTGILPLKYPDELVTANQPESVGIGVLNMTNGNHTPGSRPLYVPEEYRAVVATVLKINTPASAPRGPMPQVVEVPALVAEGRSGSSFVEIPINWSGSESVITQWRNKRYLFAGILAGVRLNSLGEPYDVLVLYKPPSGVRVNFSFIHVLPELRQLHQFCREEYMSRYH